jgi:Uncharacterized protein conserved in bacteria
METDPALIDLDAQLTAEGARFLLDTKLDHFRNPRLADALLFWRENTSPGSIPPRRHFTPQAMRSFLRNVALFERMVQQDGTYRVRARLTGQEFTKVYTEMSGHFIDEIVPDKYLRRWTLLIDAVLGYRRPIRTLAVPEAFDRKHSVVELLLAPLAGDDGEPSLVLVVCSFEFGTSWQTIWNEEILARAKAE